MHTIASPYLDHTTSATSVALLSLLLLGAVIAAFVVMSTHRQAAALARAAVAGPHSLRPGLAVLRGVVATEHGGPAITVRIRQSGTERTHKGRTSHTWKEVSRELEAQPFSLVLDNGTRVDVEPGEAPFLIDELAEVSRPSHAERVLEAHLSNRERLFVEGVLAGKRGAGATGDGYRGGELRWTLRPADGAHMLLCTESLEERHERRERFWRNTGIVLGGILSISQVVAFSLFWPLMMSGVTCDAEIAQLTQHVTRGRRGREVHHYVVVGAVTECAGAPHLEGLQVSDELGFSAWSRLSEGDHVPFVILPSDPRVHEIGTHAGLRALHLFYLLGVAAIGAFIGYRMYRRSLAWYEQSSVRHEGLGPL